MTSAPGLAPPPRPTSHVRVRAVDWFVQRPWIAALVVAALSLAIPWLGINATWVRIATLTAIFALVVSGINLTWGYAGEFSLGQAAVFALGAYVAGYLSLHGVTDMFAQLGAASAAGAIVGLVVSLPGLRVSGLSFAMTSFFLVLLIPSIAGVLPGITGGYSGLYGIPQMTLFGTLVGQNGYVVICMAVLVLWLMFMRGLILSEYGRSFEVLRESPNLAASLGIPVVRQKVKIYVLGSVPAAMAGFLFAHLDGFVSPDDFSFSIAVGLIAASVIGGRRSLYGAVFGAFLLQLGPYVTASFTGYSLIIYGALLLVGAILTSGGVAGIASAWVARGIAFVRGGGLPPASSVSRDLDSAASAVPALGDQGRKPEQVEVRGVARSFGGVRALDDVSISLTPGHITALVGPNGSGKTTLLNVLSGVYRPDEGTVLIGEDRLDRSSAHKCYALGVSRTFQTPRIPGHLTTVDVIATGMWMTDSVDMARSVLRSPAARRKQARHRSQALAYLADLGLEDVAYEQAASLPLGLRRLVEVGRAALSQPRLLLLDEPASGLAIPELRQLAGLLQRLRGTSIVTLIVEHNVEFVKSLADYVYVLDNGRVIAHGMPDAVMRDPAVIESYIGKIH